MHASCCTLAALCLSCLPSLLSLPNCRQVVIPLAVAPPSPDPAPSFLPRNVAIIGYARTQLTNQQLRDKLRPRLKGSDKERDDFLGRCTYVAGGWGL